MSDDTATNWVTIKVPEEDRDRAKDYRPDEATWADCLVAGAERLNDHMDSDDATYIDPTIDLDAVAEGVADRVESSGGAGPDAIAREVARQVDYAELAKRVADELEGRMR